MNKICTDINQCKKFIELGIDINTADLTVMDLPIQNGDRFKFIQNKLPGDIFPSITDGKSEKIPAWSLSALLSMMPKSICIKQSEHSGYFYFLEWQFANDNSLRYVGHDGKCLIDIYSDHDVKWKDSIDTAFEMICWLKENNKL